jgi:hypothetical protein
MQFFYDMFFMLLYKQSSRVEDVLEHVMQAYGGV